jgi:endonuclease/exonuclease/phosphatase family metal-dependent hydrolase
MLKFLLISLFTIVELNCENLFDCNHDSLKQDTEYLPTSLHHWTKHRYWTKLDDISREIISCGGEGSDWTAPDVVALCEVENDSVLRDLTKRSLLRNAQYEYIMTDSPDERGIDVALLYSPFAFRLINHHSIRIKPIKDMRPTRDILYASGMIISGDTVHIFVIHAPSRFGGERATRQHRVLVGRYLCASIDSIRSLSPNAKIFVAGDFNDYGTEENMKQICSHDMKDVSFCASGRNGAKGTYRYKGEWGSIDHIFVSQSVAPVLVECRINDEKYMLEEDEKYGGVRPFRTYIGPRYHGGTSDHLPLFARFNIGAWNK